MRAIAAWSVVAYHMGCPLGLGSQAVEFFFVLSGFLITWLLLKEEDLNGRISLRGFFVRRSLRIFPPFYVYWLVSIVAMLVASWPIPWGVMWAAFFYVSNWYHAIYGPVSSPVSHCWSLGLEEQYYLLWPLAFAALATRKQFRIWSVGAVILLIWLRRAECFSHEGSDDYVYHALDTRVDQVLVGTWTAIAIHQGGLRWLARLLASSPWLIAITLTLLALQFQQDDRGDWRGLRGLGFVVESVLFMVLILQVLCHSRFWLVRWLDWRLMVHLGALSYSTYLWHQLPVGAARYRLTHLDPTVRAILVVLAILVLAHLSYYFVERPSLRLKNRISGRSHRHEAKTA